MKPVTRAPTAEKIAGWPETQRQAFFQKVRRSLVMRSPQKVTGLSVEQVAERDGFLRADMI